jgi:hypothetical protein
MKAEDVTDTLTMALQASGCDSARVVQRPRLLSDNGPSYVSSDLAAWLSDKGMEHTRGAPCHPQTQGKIERWHQTLKNPILLENYFLPGDLERKVAAFVDHYNHRRYHESIGNLTPADVYFGRGDIIMLERGRIKRETIKRRRLLHRQAAAKNDNPDGPEPPLAHTADGPKFPDDGQASMKAGRNALPASIVSMPRSRISFTSRSCSVQLARSTRPLACEELAQMISMFMA